MNIGIAAVQTKLSDTQIKQPNKNRMETTTEFRTRKGRTCNRIDFPSSLVAQSSERRTFDRGGVAESVRGGSLGTLNLQ
jgi:hypothetical protein